MIQLNNVKTQELIKIKNYQYKTMNIKHEYQYEFK